MANFIGGIISVTLGAIVLANVFMTTVHGTNTTGWTASEIALWAVLGLAGVIGILFGVLNVFGIM
jgi:hypothetical protein